MHLDSAGKNCCRDRKSVHTSGNDDVLYQANLRVVQELETNGVSVMWYGGIGRHQWTFWNNMLPYVMRWLVDGIFPEGEHGGTLNSVSAVTVGI